MTEIQTVERALGVLSGPKLTSADARVLAPHKPGLYAIYVDELVWEELRLTRSSPGAPLYVGKAEHSLHGRDVRTHFASGRTGSSTVRRSLAALLVDDLSLEAVPRNREVPDRSANFGLTECSDNRLTRWMDERLGLAFWVKDGQVDLADLEAEVLARFRPPLNLTKVGESRRYLRDARKRMAKTARDWSSTLSENPS